MDENMMDIVVHDMMHMGNHPDSVDEYEPGGPGLDPRPRLKPLTLEKYLRELKLTPEQYEKKY